MAQLPYPRHRSALRAVAGAVMRERMDRKRVTGHVAAWTREHVELPRRERFQEVAEQASPSPHDGNFARCRVRPSEFAAWQEVRRP